MRLATYRWLVPVPACVVLQSSFGAFYATGVFTSRLHDAALTYALGVASVLMALSLTGAGLLLHRQPPPHSPARPLCVVSSALLGFGVLLPVLDGLGLSAAAALVGTGYGVIYVISIAVLQAWVPERPGTAAGIAVTAGGVGTLVYVALNTLLMEALGSPGTAMQLAVCLQTVLAVVASAALTMPPSLDWDPSDDFSHVVQGESWNATAPVSNGSWAPRPGSDADLEASRPRIAARFFRSGRRAAAVLDEDTPLLRNDLKPGKTGKAVSIADSRELAPTTSADLSKELPVMSTREMLADPAFYILLMTTAAAAGPGFGIVLHGSRMLHVQFGMDPNAADKHFFVITLIGVAGRFGVGLIVDAYADAAKRTMLARLGRSPNDMTQDISLASSFEAARSVTVAQMFIQLVALILVFPITIRGYDFLFTVMLSLVYLTFCGAAVTLPCLCRATFAPQNSTLAFSLIGLALGGGDYLFSTLVADCAKAHPLTVPGSGEPGVFDYRDHLHDYDTFFVISIGFTVVGWLASLFLAPGKYATDEAGRKSAVSVVDGLYDFVRSRSSGNLPSLVTSKEKRLVGLRRSSSMPAIRRGGAGLHRRRRLRDTGLRQLGAFFRSVGSCFGASGDADTP